MQIRVLGPLEVNANGLTLVPSARKPRQVLAVMLVRNMYASQAELFIRELWDERPPRSAMATLQTYVLQIRKLIARAMSIPMTQVAGEVLRTCGNGYQLRFDESDSDLLSYQRLVSEGHRAIEHGDDHRAVEAFNGALGLWRGGVLVDVEHGMLLSAEVASLEQSRLVCLEARFDAELRLGKHHSVLSELTGLVMTYRENENLHAQYMLALHRCGLRVKALEVYHQFRNVLVDELGIEPSPKLQRLHGAVLAGEPRLDEHRDLTGVIGSAAQGR